MTALIILAAVLTYLAIGAVVFRVSLPYRWRRAYAAHPKIKPTFFTDGTESFCSRSDREIADGRRRRHVTGSSCATLFGWPVWVPVAFAAHTIERADPDPLAPWEVAAMQDRITALEKELEADA